MSNLIVRDRLISEDILTILKKVKSEITNGKLSHIEKRGDHILVTCPYHKNGHELHSSCSIYDGDGELPKGTFHCFTCKESGTLSKFIGECFDRDISYGEQWILDNFGDTYIKYNVDLEPIEISRKNQGNKILDSKILSNYTKDYSYLNKRKISNEICEKFEILYDKNSREVIFPLRDERNNLVGLTKRKIDYRKYELPKVVYKPIDLLYYIINNKIKEVYVCESQINALYLWSLGYPAIALLGTGSKYQYDLLNKSGILFYHLCFDGDEAGDKGIVNFKENINKNCIVDVIQLPRGKDINDLDEEEINKLINTKNLREEIN